MKRYDAVNTNGDPLYAPSPDGEMVFYSDVAALVAMNAELVEALNISIDTIKEICHYRDVPPPMSMYRRVETALLKSKELSHESSRG